jgi:hypothetical protein
LAAPGRSRGCRSATGIFFRRRHRLHLVIAHPSGDIAHDGVGVVTAFLVFKVFQLRDQIGRNLFLNRFHRAQTNLESAMIAMFPGNSVNP